jgi:hypothetical protein
MDKKRTIKPNAIKDRPTHPTIAFSKKPILTTVKTSRKIIDVI